MTAAVVSLTALREQRARRAPRNAATAHEPGRIVARFTTAGAVADDPRGVVVVNLGDEVVRGRVFLASRDHFGQVRLVLEHPLGHEPRATAVVLRAEATLLVLASVSRSGSAGRPGGPGPRDRR